jgi:leader peptidase (prepilin peptidase)/N-methyltransferase
MSLIAAVVCAVIGGGASWFVPALVGVVPEPEPEPDVVPGPVPGPDPEPVPEPVPELVPEPKRLYADIARGPGMAWRSALIGAVLAGAIGAAVGWAWPLVYLVPFVPLGIALSVIDWHTKRLPTWYLAPAYPVVIVLVALCGLLTQDWLDLRRAAFGWLVMGGFYFLTNLVSPRLVGYGDVRLSGLLGMGLGYLGWSELLVGMYVAFFVFGIPPLLIALVRRDRSILKMRMPFGPAMLGGAALGVVFGAPLVDWYLGTGR